VVACLMLFRVPLCIAVAASLVLPALAHASHVVQPTSVRESTIVPAGGARTLTLECPGSSVAVNGAITRQGGGVDLRRSAPGREAGDWRFRLAAAEGVGPRARAVLRCVGIQLPDGVAGAGLQVNTQRRTNIELDPGESKPVRIGCGRAWTATGYGLFRGADGDVRLAAVVPTAHGWIFRLENIGSEEAVAGVAARCLRTAVRADRGGTLRFRAARREFDDVSVSGGRVSFVHSCRRGEFSLATGSAVDPLDGIALIRSHPTTSLAGRWTFGQSSAGDRVTTHLVCLRRGSHFG
jgi:hypothetical protein